MAGKSAGYTDATVKLKVQSYKQRENEEIKKSANQKMEMTVIQPNYQSEVLKLFAKNQQKMIKRSNDSHAMVRFFRKSKVRCIFPVHLPGSRPYTAPCDPIRTKCKSQRRNPLNFSFESVFS